MRGVRDEPVEGRPRGGRRRQEGGDRGRRRDRRRRREGTLGEGPFGPGGQGHQLQLRGRGPRRRRRLRPRRRVHLRPGRQGPRRRARDAADAAPRRRRAPLGPAPDTEGAGRAAVPGGAGEGAVRDRDVRDGAQHAGEDGGVHGAPEVGRAGAPMGKTRREFWIWVGRFFSLFGFYLVLLASFLTISPPPPPPNTHKKR